MKKSVVRPICLFFALTAMFLVVGGSITYGGFLLADLLIAFLSK